MQTRRVGLVVAMALVWVCADAHICSLFPPQQGGPNITLPGDPSCYKRSGPCGGVAPGKASAVYAPGQRVNVVVQQNLNHWYPEHPGHLDAALACVPAPKDSDFAVLAVLPDAPMHDQVWQTNYTFTVYMPENVLKATTCILRVRYVAFNPDEKAPPPNVDSTFYNCATIEIDPALVAADHPLPQRVDVAKYGFATTRPRGPDPTGCATPPQWEATSVEQRPAGLLRRTYAYDATNLRVFVDRRGPISVDPNIVRVASWTNYHNRDQYVYFEYASGAPVCELYGADAFYAWTQGDMPESGGQSFAYQVADGAILANVWTNNATFEWASNVDNCLPVWRFEIGAGLMELFTNATVGISDPAVFDVPAICTSAVKQFRCAH